METHKRSMLIVAPHPDDEVLGVGGTMARAAAAGDDVYVTIVTKGHPPDFDEELIARGRREALVAHRLLGVKETLFHAFPAASLDTVPQKDVTAALRATMEQVRPDVLYLPFVGDIHLDHQIAFTAGLVAGRPNSAFAPRAIYAYETLSETNWNAPFLSPRFAPNVFVDITGFLETKIAAMEAYASQLKPFPHERSCETLRALATLRGSTVGRTAAEAFVLIRQTL